jgi:hypothetical protein
LLTLLLSIAILISAAIWILMRDRWEQMDRQDPRRKLLAHIASDLVVHGKRLRREPGYES